MSHPLSFLKLLRYLFSAGVTCVVSASLAAAELSPEKWGATERARVEALAHSPAPPAARAVNGASGVVSGTMSSMAARAGVEALKQGGTAADAAAAVALTQVTAALGSSVSFGGMMQLSYYEAGSGKVYSMNAGFASYLAETDPQSIPNASAALDVQPGRKTLVPGFMAGLAAMHHRFGKLPFADLFAPAIWYAEQGVEISPLLAEYFPLRQSQLSRTPEGKRFMHQAGEHLPKAGDLFIQADLAKTLRGVAEHGATYMYTGAWGEAFVTAVRATGGKVTLEDMKRYQPIWEEPLSTEFLGRTVYAPGRSTEGGYQILQALNLIEERKIAALHPYWQDSKALLELSRVLQFAAAGIYAHPVVVASAQATGTVLTPEDRATKRYARAAVPLLDAVFNPGEAPKHSDAIVVIDRWGNVAALVHSINTVIWGSTGLVVGGIPLSDAASFQQVQLAKLKPGGHLPNEMAPVIVTDQGKPVLAIAAIGSSLVPETARLLLGTLGNKLGVQTVMAAPPLLLNFDFTKRATIAVPETGYAPGLLDELRSAGINVEKQSQRQVWTLEGTAVVGAIDSKTGERHTGELPGIFSFAEGY